MTRSVPGRQAISRAYRGTFCRFRMKVFLPLATPKYFLVPTRKPKKDLAAQRSDGDNAGDRNGSEGKREDRWASTARGDLRLHEPEAEAEQEHHRTREGGKTEGRRRK